MAAVSGALPSLPEVEASSFDHLAAAAAYWTRTAQLWESAFDEVARETLHPGGSQWEGDSAESEQHRANLDLVEVRGAVWQLHDAAAIARLGPGQLETNKRAVLEAVDEAYADGYEVGDDYTVTDTSTGGSREQRAARQSLAQHHAAYIRHRVAALVAADRDIAAKLDTGTTGLDGITFAERRSDTQMLGFGPDRQAPLAPPGKVEDEANRRQNQIDAFKQVFGREPTSPTDWSTAAALDPHSYDPKYQGFGPEVRVVKIRPVPGQGEVRVSQWIEQRDVYGWPPGRRDFGNDRVTDPHFGPENTKVTTYIDYENGIVVMRQNPSIELNRDGMPHQVKVGVPHGSVTQTNDGAVRIRYDAANPLAPEIMAHPGGPFRNHPWSVNGDLVFTPQPGGVHIDGTRTDYPSMEVYQDSPNGTTHTVLTDPAQSGRSWGPAANLPGHHDIGIGGRAFEPFDKGGWNPRYDVRVPLPSTDFGPVTGPPSVPALPRGAATPS